MRPSNQWGHPGLWILCSLSLLATLSLGVAAFQLESAPARLAALLAPLLVLTLGFVTDRKLRGLAAVAQEERRRVRDIEDQAWQMALLGQMPEELGVQVDDEAILETATKVLASALGASRTLIYQRLADESYRLCAQFHVTEAFPLDSGGRLPSLLENEGVSLEPWSDADLEGSDNPERQALAHRLQVRSLLAVPILRSLRAEAVLAVHQCDRPRVWRTSEIRFVERFAEQVRRALDRAELYRKQAQAADVRAGLLTVAQALSAARKTGPLLELAAAVATPLTGCRRSMVFLARPDGDWEVVAAHGWGAAAGIERRRLPSSSEWIPTFEQSLEKRRPIDLLPGQRGMGARNPWPELAIESALVVPLQYGRETLGVFLLERGSEIDWEEMDREVAQVVAELTATALKNARLFEALQSSEARYLDLYDNAPDMYQTIDPRGRLLDCNLTESFTLGFAKKELIGRSFASLLTDESLPDWRRLSTVLFEEGFVRDGALKLRNRSGEVLEVLVNASVLRGTEGGPDSARMVLRDVTAYRKLEHQLRQSQKLEVVGTLAGGVAHDFNNLLSGIMGYASLLRSQLVTAPLASKYLETIERSAERGAELTGRLLAASRKLPVKREPVNPNRVVEETLELLARTFNKKVRMVKRLDPAVKAMIADRSQLQQVVLNLCVNARDAMPEGGLLRVESEVIDTGRRLRLTVEDSGVGIEPADMERLFEPFFSTKGEAGTGLGLSVVYGIVKAHGGDVRVKSSPGKGSRFDLFFPVRWAEENSELDLSGLRRQPVRGRGELILLVDDESVLRELGKEILESFGYRVETAASGEEAVAFLRQSNSLAEPGKRDRSRKEPPVSLVILDLVMPGLDGDETFRELRKINRDVPVLLSSGLSPEGAIREILNRGASGFVAKPYAIGDLTEAVSVALKGTEPPLVH